MHPGAVIIDRPYDSLEEFLEGDAWTVARGDMILIGVNAELGASVEFSIVLSTGESVVAGEGRVVELIPPIDDFVGGTRVKFRKLDADSKAVLRRALELQRRRALAEAEAAEAEAAANAATAELLPSSAVQDLPSSAAVNEPPAATAPEPPAAELAPPPPAENEAPPPAVEAVAPPQPEPEPAPVAAAPLPPMSLDPFPAAPEAPVEPVAAAAPVEPVAVAAPVEPVAVPVEPVAVPFEPVAVPVEPAVAAAPAEPRRQSNVRHDRPRQVDPPHNRNELLERLRARRRGNAA